MTPNATILELMRHHVLWPDEPIERVREWPDGVALTTPMRHFVAGSEPAGWAATRADWVTDLILATRDDLIVHGEPERFGFLLPANGAEIYLNDSEQLAELGRRVPDQLDPIAYAELVVSFHTYSSAVRRVITDPVTLYERYDPEDLPPVQLPRLDRGDGTIVLTFAVSIEYRRPIVGELLDLSAWTVTIPGSRPARWESELIAERIQPVGIG